MVGILERDSASAASSWPSRVHRTQDLVPLLAMPCLSDLELALMMLVVLLGFAWVRTRRCGGVMDRKSPGSSYG